MANKENSGYISYRVASTNEIDGLIDLSNQDNHKVSNLDISDSKTLKYFEEKEFLMYDEVLEKLGGFGLYQFLLLFL